MLAASSLLRVWSDPAAERRARKHALLRPYLEPTCGHIPRHIHFVNNLWEDRELTEKEMNALESWMRINKGWDVHIWDNDKLDVLFKALGEHVQDTWRTIKALPNHGQRADLTRSETAVLLISGSLGRLGANTAEATHPSPLFVCLFGWLAGLFGCLVAWLVAWLLGCLVAWLLGCLFGWLFFFFLLLFFFARSCLLLLLC